MQKGSWGPHMGVLDWLGVVSALGPATSRLGGLEQEPSLRASCSAAERDIEEAPLGGPQGWVSKAFGVISICISRASTMRVSTHQMKNKCG